MKWLLRFDLDIRFSDEDVAEIHKTCMENCVRKEAVFVRINSQYVPGWN